MILLKPFFTLGFLFLGGLAANAQSVEIGPSTLDAAGNSSTTGGNTYEYAIGQVAAPATFSSPSLIVTPGVLQPNINPNSVTGLAIKPGELQVFPSPAQHSVFLQSAFGTAGTLQWGLYAADGKLARAGSVTLRNGNEKQEIDISALATGPYFLQVSWLQSGMRYSAGYKIQKLR